MNRAVAWAGTDHSASSRQLSLTAAVPLPQTGQATGEAFR